MTQPSTNHDTRLSDERLAEMLAGPDRCPTCRCNWGLFPPAKIDDGSGLARCVECKAVYHDPDTIRSILTELQALRAPTETEPEPVAWRYSSGMRTGPWRVTVDRELAYREHDQRNLVEPLYTHPLRNPSPSDREVSDEMVFAAMVKADELGEPLDDIDAREILTAALQSSKRG